VSQEARPEVLSAPEEVQKAFAVAVVPHTLEQPELDSGRESEQVQIEEQDSTVVSAQKQLM
jgi:riboflavin synthase alpha subunit